MESPVRNRHNNTNNTNNGQINHTTTTSARSTPSVHHTTFATPGETLEERPHTPRTARDDALERGSPGDDERTLRESRYHNFASRVRGLHLERVPTFIESANATAQCSQLNSLLPLVIFSWMSQFAHLNLRATFVLSFLALIPLEKILQFAAKQSVLYLGHTVGDLVTITAMNAVEAILAILLLLRGCELKLLQATITGVIILHLLLAPGVAFAAGGAHLSSQRLHESQTQMNQTMMTMGVMCLVLPAAFYAGVKRVGVPNLGEVITPYNRDIILQMSRGMAIIMLLSYIASRIYALNPPGDEIKGDDYAATGGDEAFEHEEERIKKEIPKISPLFCLILLFVLIASIAITAEGLVHSIDFVKENSIIQEEWFGLILIPLVSFSGDGLVTFSSLIRRAVFREPKALHKLADAQPIDLSIQFLLFWTPVLVLISWGVGKSLPLLFDIFEVAILVGACFVVNYVTADGKTTVHEGVTMICFYVVIALVAWYYPGQEYMEYFYPCIGRMHEGGIAVKSHH